MTISAEEQGSRVYGAENGNGGGEWSGPKAQSTVFSRIMRVTGLRSALERELNTLDSRLQRAIVGIQRASSGW